MIPLTPDQQADVQAIIAEGSKDPRPGFIDMQAAHRAYVRLCHTRGWSGTVARLVYEAWHTPMQAKWDDDIPF